MKTKSNPGFRANFLAIFLALTALSAIVSAQPRMNSGKSDSTDEAFTTLGVLMNQVEQSLRYVPPTVDYDEAAQALDILDQMMGDIDEAIAYHAPVEDPAEGNGILVQENQKADEEQNNLASTVIKPDGK